MGRLILPESNKNSVTHGRRVWAEQAQALQPVSRDGMNQGRGKSEAVLNEFITLGSLKI